MPSNYAAPWAGVIKCFMTKQLPDVQSAESGGRPEQDQVHGALARLRSIVLQLQSQQILRAHIKFVSPDTTVAGFALLESHHAGCNLMSL